MVFVLTLCHYASLLWIVLGIKVEESWIDIIGMSIDDNFNLYLPSYYFILTTITTVGYGDFTYNTWQEKCFVIMIEFVGLTFFSFLIGSGRGILSG